MCGLLRLRSPSSSSSSTPMNKLPFDGRRPRIGDRVCGEFYSICFRFPALPQPSNPHRVSESDGANWFCTLGTAKEDGGGGAISHLRRNRNFARDTTIAVGRTTAWRGVAVSAVSLTGPGHVKSII